MRTILKWACVCAVAGLFLAAGLASAADAGKDIYAGKCAMCHGADGVAKEMWAKKGMKNFNDAAWQKGMTDDAMVKAITDGIPDKKMPSYKDKLKADEIQAVVKYIRTLAPAK